MVAIVHMLAVQFAKEAIQYGKRTLRMRVRHPKEFGNIDLYIRNSLVIEVGKIFICQFQPSTCGVFGQLSLFDICPYH